MEQAREALKKLNVFAEKAARMGLFREGRVASGEPNRVWSERHESFAFGYIGRVAGYASGADSTPHVGVEGGAGTRAAACSRRLHPRVALWALALNFAAPLIRKWSRRAAVLD